MQQLHKQNLSTRPAAPPATPASTANPPSRRPPQSKHTAAIIALVVLLVAVFGTGLFVGWVFGTRSSGIVQPGATPGTTTPPESVPGTRIEVQREAVIANVRPTVVQVNVLTPNGEGLGSGVFLDSRGYIVTNNHVVADA